MYMLEKAVTIVLVWICFNTFGKHCSETNVQYIIRPGGVSDNIDLTNTLQLSPEMIKNA